jgi:hypothetical protein
MDQQRYLEMVVPTHHSRVVPMIGMAVVAVQVREQMEVPALISEAKAEQVALVALE